MKDGEVSGKTIPLSLRFASAWLDFSFKELTKTGLNAVKIYENVRNSCIILMAEVVCLYRDSESEEGYTEIVKKNFEKIRGLTQPRKKDTQIPGFSFVDDGKDVLFTPIYIKCAWVMEANKISAEENTDDITFIHALNAACMRIFSEVSLAYSEGKERERFFNWIYLEVISILKLLKSGSIQNSLDPRGVLSLPYERVEEDDFCFHLVEKWGELASSFQESEKMESFTIANLMLTASTRLLVDCMDEFLLIRDISFEDLLRETFDMFKLNKTMTEHQMESKKIYTVLTSEE